MADHGFDEARLRRLITANLRDGGADKVANLIRLGADIANEACQRGAEDMRERAAKYIDMGNLPPTLRAKLADEILALPIEPNERKEGCRACQYGICPEHKGQEESDGK
jgi:hypothetical protein